MVNIATRGTIKEQPGQRNPLLDDPFFRRFFDAPPDSRPRERQFQSAGSGVIVDAKNGYIITNHHVVENASEITITLLDNRTFQRQGHRQRRGRGYRRAAGQAAELDRHVVRRFGQARGRRLRGRHRQSLRPRSTR